jgi:hypothetical protein
MYRPRRLRIAPPIGSSNHTEVWTMLRLTIWKVLIGIAVGAIFASLQGEPPVAALAGLAITCPVHRADRC